jgi:hypothetical protein
MRSWVCPAHGVVSESEVAWESHSQIPVHQSPCNRDVEPADAVEGDRPCLVGRACRAEICRDGCKWPDPDAVSGRGVEPSREDRHQNGDPALIERLAAKCDDLEARVVELEAALREIRDNEGVAPGALHWRTQAARALAAAGEGEDRPPRSEPDPDQPFHPCACGGDHLTIDHPSGSRLPEPNHE